MTAAERPEFVDAECRLVLQVTVRGVPVPQGSIRSLGKGRPSIHSNADRLLPWREQIQHAIEQTITGTLTGPVAVDLTFTMPKPKSAPKRRRTFPVARPDVDKLARACLDALQASGAVKDDSQVVELAALKAFPDEHPLALPVPGVRLRMFEVCG